MLAQTVVLEAAAAGTVSIDTSSRTLGPKIREGGSKMRTNGGHSSADNVDGSVVRARALEVTS